MAFGQVDKTFATVLWGNIRDRVKRVFVGMYWPRLSVVHQGGLGAKTLPRWSQTSWTPLARLLGKKAIPGNSLRDRTGGMVCVTRKEGFFLKGDRVDLEREDAIRYFFGCSEWDLELSW